jgi:O-acetyl-ADP-ribose deacetylase (regulator of RNase III)
MNVMKKQVGEVVLEAVQGDIANQPDISAVVNAANAQLMPGGGVAGAIHRAAGPGLAEKCRPMAPIEPGQAVISGAHNLPNKYVIHCLGPVYGRDKPENLLLADCYKNALRLAMKKKLIRWHSLPYQPEFSAIRLKQQPILPCKPLLKLYPI